MPHPSQPTLPILIIAIIALLPVLFVACQTTDDIEVQAEYAPGVITELGKTFDWLPARSERSRMSSDAELDAFVKSTIEEELVRRGYAKQVEEPDFLVNYDLGSWRVRENPFVGAEVHEQGAIGIMLVAPDGKTGLWRGIAEGRVEPSTTPPERRARIRRAIRSILAELPRLWR